MSEDSTKPLSVKERMKMFEKNKPDADSMIDKIIKPIISQGPPERRLLQPTDIPHKNPEEHKQIPVDQPQSLSVKDRLNFFNNLKTQKNSTPSINPVPYPISPIKPNQTQTESVPNKQPIPSPISSQPVDPTPTSPSKPTQIPTKSVPIQHSVPSPISPKPSDPINSTPIYPTKPTQTPKKSVPIMPVAYSKISEESPDGNYDLFLYPRKSVIISNLSDFLSKPRMPLDSFIFNNVGSSSIDNAEIVSIELNKPSKIRSAASKPSFDDFF